MEFRCPACRSLMDVGATNCPICLRPRSRQEMLRDLQGVKKQERSKKRRLLAVAALGAAAAALYTHPEWITLAKSKAAPAMTPIAARAKARMDETVKANWPDTAPAEGQGPITPKSSFAAAVDAATGGTAKPAPIPSQGTAPVTPPVVQPPPDVAATPPPDAAPAFWKVQGSVYWLLDLKAGAGFELVFAPTSGEPARKARVGRDGRYSISLPALESGAGYRVSVRQAGREVPYLEEASAPYRGRTRAQREDALQEASQAPVLHVPLSPEGASTHLDLALFR